MPADFAAWSNVTIDGQRQTWQQLYEREHQRCRTAEALVSILLDLNRCEHGRHEGDDCYGCGGPSLGNPHALAVSQDRSFDYDPDHPRRIGFGLDGVSIDLPARGQTGDPHAWRPTR